MPAQNSITTSAEQELLMSFLGTVKLLLRKREKKDITVEVGVRCIGRMVLVHHIKTKNQVFI
jgi:hypothetical protein